MDYLYVYLGLGFGAVLTAVGVFTAIVYTPYGYSPLDTLVTAFTGASLQVGNLFLVTALTAAAFDLLASFAGVDLPILVPMAIGYVVFHAALYRSSIAVTALQSTPYDPETALSAPHLRLFSSLFPSFLSAPASEEH